MGFLIEHIELPFDKYRGLSSFQERFPVVRDIISFLDEWYDNNKTTIQVKTSGSTGKPKTIFLQKTALLSSAKATAKYFDFQSGRRALLCLPVTFIAGKMMLVRSIYSQLQLRIVQPTGSPELPDDNYYFVPMTPFQFLNSYKNSKLSSIKKILLGGGPVNSDVLNLLPKLKSKVYHGLGMTETITHIAIRLLNQDKPEPIYRTLPGIQLSIDTESRLCISSNYFENVQTNDLVELITPNSFRWLGRHDNVINSGGIKIFPEAIEIKMASIIPCPFIIVGEFDEKLGEKLVLIIESNISSDFSDILTQVQAHMTKYELPKKVYLLSEFVRTANGKIKRSETYLRAIKNL